MTDYVQHALTVLLELEKVWGRARIGLVLTQAFYDNRCWSSEEIAERIGLSKSSVQDHLKGLLNIGRCQRVTRGRNTCYVATASWAEWTRQVLTPPGT